MVNNMEIDKLTKSQIVWLCLLITIVTSVMTAIVTITLIRQAPPPITQIVDRVIEKAIGGATGNPTPSPQTPASSENTGALSREDAVVKVVKDISPAVVSVIASKDLPVIEQTYIDPFGGDSFLKGLFPDLRVPQYTQKGTQKQQISSGTGFFVDSSGLLLTNKHVVSDLAADYTIVMNDGKKFSVKVLARDPLQDLAILKVGDKSAPKSFPSISLGDSSSANIGQTVIAVGNALGEFRNTVSVGIISGLNRNIVAQGSPYGPEDLEGLIQTDAAINPGNSGGPLVDLKGSVIGMNSALAQGGQNIGFALPINIAKKDIKQVEQFGKIRYPYLGIRYSETDKGLTVESGGGTDGNQVGVELNSPASKAGIQEGDTILMTRKEFLNLLNSREVGDIVNLKILRKGVTITVSVTLGERPEGV